MPVGILLLGCVKVAVVQIKLHHVARYELVAGLGALPIDLDALKAQVFMHLPAGKQGNCFAKEFVHALPAVIG